MSVPKGYKFGPRKSPPPRPQEVRDRIGRASKGHVVTAETREKIRATLTGQSFTEERRINISMATMGKRKAEENPAWKGDNVGYGGLHEWVKRELGQPETCEHCGKTGLIGLKIHWANKSRTYLRELTDWIRLCAKCHWQYDRGSLTLKLAVDEL